MYPCCQSGLSSQSQRSSSSVGVRSLIISDALHVHVLLLRETAIIAGAKEELTSAKLFRAPASFAIEGEKAVSAQDVVLGCVRLRMEIDHGYLSEIYVCTRWQELAGNRKFMARYHKTFTTAIG